MKVKKLLKVYEGKYVIWSNGVVVASDSNENKKIKNKRVLFCNADNGVLNIDI